MQTKLKSLVHIVVCTLVALTRSLEQATREPRRLAQSMVEYAIIAALVAVVALVAVRALGSSVSTAFNDITHQVDSTKSTGP